jgi:PPM family protein phosphatase
MLSGVDPLSTVNPSAFVAFLGQLNAEEPWLMTGVGAVAVLSLLLVVSIVLRTGRKAPSDAAPRVGAPPEDEPQPVLQSDIRALTTLPRLMYDEDAEDDGTLVGIENPPTATTPMKILYDADAEPEEPTQAQALILVTAIGHTDRGVKRKRNEDNLLVLEDQALFVVADGMGGCNGGAVASKVAVDTIGRAFRTHQFRGSDHQQIPKRASELARAVQMANETIFELARHDPSLSGMGTTVCAARFSPNKQRLYIAHVGDSRVYRLRRGVLRQMTADHTMADLGVGGESGTYLSRAVGIWRKVKIDVVLGKPLPDDVYLLCSDGLNKMVPDDQVARALNLPDPKESAAKLIDTANANGGLDNVTVIIVRVEGSRRSRAA